MFPPESATWETCTNTCGGGRGQGVRPAASVPTGVPLADSVGDAVLVRLEPAQLRGWDFADEWA